MQSEAVVQSVYFDLEVRRPEDYVWYPHAWEEPEEPFLKQLMDPVERVLMIDGRVFCVRASHVTAAELLDLAQRRSREFVERIVGDVRMASRENELLREEQRRRVECEQSLQQRYARVRVREGRVEPQIRIVDTPIEPMAPCMSMSA